MLHTPVTSAPKYRAKWTEKVPYTPGSAVDEDLPPAPDGSFFQKPECRKSADRDRGGLFIRQIGRDRCNDPVFQGPFFTHARILGIRAKTKTGKCVDPVTYPVPLDPVADRFDLPGQLETEYGHSLRPEETIEETRERPGPPFACARPRGHSSVAWILISTSFSRGTGSGTSSSRRTSGGPYSFSVHDCFHEESLTSALLR